MKTLALFVVDGALMLLLAIALVVYEPDASWAAEYIGAAGAVIAGAAILASVVIQIRKDTREPHVEP